MGRCLSCGRRVAALHQPCGTRPVERAAEAPRPLPEPPGYRAVRLLGGGGFGVVIEAVEEASGARAAVKVARGGVPEARPQLAREAEALRAVGPPFVPRIIGAGTVRGGEPFLAMELVEGQSLGDRMAAAPGPFSRDDLAAAARSLLDALAAVHAAGFAHGDLKPENVMLSGAPERARLLDFGLSTRLGGARAAATGAHGTAEYMSPEQCEMQPPDDRSDLYAAGAILFELATGRPPFFGNPADVRHAHLNLRPPRPSLLADVPRALEDPILRCLAKAPGDRFASAAALRDALEAAFARPDSPRAAIVPRGAREATGGARTARRRVAVLFLEAANPIAVQAAAAPFGGVLAHASAKRLAFVFDFGAGGHPVRLAAEAAGAVLAGGLARRALVNLVTVAAQARPAGPDRYLSSVFAQEEAYPTAEDPLGVMVTVGAAETAPGLRLTPIAARGGHLLLRPPDVGAQEATVLHDGVTPLVGRDDVLADLADLANEAFAGAPIVTAVLGEAGMGKSRVAAALGERLRRRVAAPRVVELRARGGLDVGEDGTLRALLRAALHLAPSDAQPADGGRAALLLALPSDVAEEAWPAVALALGWLSTGSPQVASRAAAPGALAWLAMRAAGAALRRDARHRPICVILDDAHLAGGTALDALEYAALGEAGAPVFVCALAREDFAAARPLWGERAARSRSFRLGPLEPAAAADLCRQLVLPAEGVPARAIEALTARAQGIPMLLVELVRSLKRDGLVRRHEQGGSYYLATDHLERVPEMPVIDWVASRALHDLADDLRPHAQLAAVLGDPLSAADTRGVLTNLESSGLGTTFPLDGEAAARRLVQQGLLLRHRDGRTSFRLPLVRDALARTLPESVQRAIHEEACRYYGDPGSGPEEERLPRLLRHAEALGRRAHAADLSLHLAESARARHAYLPAESLYARALVHLEDAPSAAKVAALRGRGLMRYRLGRPHESVEDLASAREVAASLGAVAEQVACLLDEATALDWMNDYGGSEMRLHAAEKLARDPLPGQRAPLELARGRSLFRGGRWAEAVSHLAAAARMSEEIGDAGYETLVVSLLLLGTALPCLGRTEEAAAALSRARDLATARGDDLHRSVACTNERNLCIARGDLAAAVASQREAARLGRELGVLGNEYDAEYNIAELYYQSGDVQSAEPHLRRAMDLERRHPEIAPAPLAVLLAARLRLLAGDVAGARARHSELRERLARARAMGWRGAELGPHGQVLADMVDLSTREATDDEWDELLVRSARVSVEQEPIEVVEARGRSAQRAGRMDVARRSLEAALRLAQDIPNLMASRLRRALAALDAATG